MQAIGSLATFVTDRGGLFTCPSAWRTSRTTTALWLDNRSRQPYLQIDCNIWMLLFVTLQQPFQSDCRYMPT